MQSKKALRLTCLLSVLLSACGGDGLTAPSSTSGTAGLSAGALGQRNATALPIRGTLRMSTTVTIDFPTLTLYGQSVGIGEATQLGRFTVSTSATVDLLTTEAFGPYEFTAANGDKLFGTYTGFGVFPAPLVARITNYITITGGTGRFANATGTFTVVLTDTIDPATGASTSIGSFEGQIDLNR